MKTRDIATELDRAFAAAKVNALMGGVVMGDTVDPLHAIHKTLKAKHAAGELTDEQFTKKPRELLEMLGSAARSRCMVAPRACWLWSFVPAHGRRHRDGIAWGSFPAHTRADISVEIRHSTELWPEITRPGRSSRFKQQSK